MAKETLTMTRSFNFKITMAFLLLIQGAFWAMGGIPGQQQKPAHAQTQGEEASEQSVAPPPSEPRRAQPVSLETLRLMEKIEQKTRELKKREEEVRVKEQQLKSLEQKVRADLQETNKAVKRFEELLGISEGAHEEKLDSLAKMYSSMRPEDAAPLLEAIDEKIAIQLISRMKAKIAGQVMSRLNTKVAKSISEKIAGADLPKLEEVKDEPGKK